MTRLLWVVLSAMMLLNALGCGLNSYFDPSRTGRFEYTPTTIPVLERLDVIETESETELFRATIGQTTRFPTAVNELIGLWLEGGDAALSFASGTDVLSGFTTADTDFGFSSPGLDGGSNA